MANSDYVLRAGGFGFCPVAFLTADIEHLDTAVVMTGYTSPISDGIRIGMAAMIDDEIVEIVNHVDNSLVLARGCCDTIPAAHVTGTPIWFFDDSIGRDGVEYAGTETVGVKVLPRMTTGAAVPVEASPPQQLTFNLRFARPYPPGRLEINGVPWFTGFTLDNHTDMAFTWTHRDRITQQDQLIDHLEADIGPETGVTYKVRIYKADNTLVHTEAGITGNSFDYLWADAGIDFAVTVGDHPGYALVSSVRDSLESFQSYRVDFTLMAEPFGLGYRLGASLGGVAP